jgi:histone deacetylase complex subunit SAP18
MITSKEFRGSKLYISENRGMKAVDEIVNINRNTGTLEKSKTIIDSCENSSPLQSFDRNIDTSLSFEIDTFGNSFFIDRENTVPFLIRLFPNVGPHRREDVYSAKNLPKNELQIHTWMDATLRELTELIKQAIPETRGNRRISFRRVCLKRKKTIMRQMGVVHSSSRGQEDDCMIKNKKFEIGDFIDISIL